MNEDSNFRYFTSDSRDLFLGTLVLLIVGKKFVVRN